MGWLMPRVGPRGLEFARTRVEMKAIETVVHLAREEPRRMRHMIPEHVWQLVKPYGLERDRAGDGEGGAGDRADRRQVNSDAARRPDSGALEAE
jgi:coenzyme F420 hydrogenase subunit beta